jgi:hypothetical protein
MDSLFVNNYRGKTGILTIKFAKREQYSQKLRDIYVTISDAQKLSTLKCRGNSPEWTDLTAASVVSQWLHHLLAQNEYTIWCKSALCSKYGKISHVTWKFPLLAKHCSLTVVSHKGWEVSWRRMRGRTRELWGRGGGGHELLRGGVGIMVTHCWHGHLFEDRLASLPAILYRRGPMYLPEPLLPWRFIKKWNNVGTSKLSLMMTRRFVRKHCVTAFMDTASSSIPESLSVTSPVHTPAWYGHRLQ